MLFEGDKLILKARKAAALADLQPPINTEADAKLEREAKDEERAINRICNELGLEMREVLTPPSPSPLNIDFNPYPSTHLRMNRSTQTATVSSQQLQTNLPPSMSSRHKRRITS